MNLLLIHDDSLYSALIVEFLRFQRYGVYETNDAETSYAALRQRSVDFVMCFVPDEQSERFYLLAELRQHHPSLPLIAITTNPITTQLHEQLQEHTPHYLTKPFTVAALLNTIGDATGIRKKRIGFSSTVA